MSRAKPFELSMQGVMDAWYQLKANRGAHRVYELTINDFKIDSKNNLYKFWNRLSLGSYFSRLVRAVKISGKMGGPIVRSAHGSRRDCANCYA